MSLKSFSIKSFALSAAVLSEQVLAAAGGSAAIQSKLETIKDILAGCGVAIVCGAILWAAYKIVFQGNSLQQVQGPVIGGAIAGSALYFTNLLLG